jgi:hypothetical protein
VTLANGQLEPIARATSLIASTKGMVEIFETFEVLHHLYH